MNTVATMGIAGNALCKLPLGILLDKFGPRATAVTGAIMVMVGSLLLGPPPALDRPRAFLGSQVHGCVPRTRHVNVRTVGQPRRLPSGAELDRVAWLTDSRSTRVKTTSSAPLGVIVRTTSRRR